MNNNKNIKTLIVKKPLQLDCGKTINNYPLAYIQAVEFYKDVGILDSNALKAIRNIASQVGAPSYNKTPVFKNKGRNMANHSYQNGNHHKNKGVVSCKHFCHINLHDSFNKVIGFHSNMQYLHMHRQILLIYPHLL